MPLTAPNLDDRSYSDIVAEAKTRITRYTPEWTNFNESDPGITLLELFAWMTELLAFRLNQVPDLNYIKFLQLLGIERQAAKPARAAVTFEVARSDLPSVSVPKGTQVAASGADGQPIVFETDKAFFAIGAKLAEIQTFDGTAYMIQTKKNAAAGQSFYPFGQKPRPGSALLLGFDSPAFPEDQIDLAVNLFQQVLNAPVLKSGAAIPPPAALAWEYWDGSEWSTLTVAQDGTRAFSQDGYISFKGPGKNVVSAQQGVVQAPYYWFRARLVTASYELTPSIAAIRTNTTDVTQAITFSDEILGGSDGSPNQTFTVSNTPVVALHPPLKASVPGGSHVMVTDLQLEIDEGNGFVLWRQVDDFFSSGPDDRVFTFDRNTGVVTTGSGEYGRIPLANPANPTGNVVARMYRSGGGSQGNVPANSITQLLTTVPSINSAKNYNAATGGTDEESVVDAKLRAPAALKSKERAVTEDDFVYLAKQAPGANVKRALALPLSHPDYPSAQVPGVVTVVVVPNSQDAPPTPNQTTLKAVCAYLDAHRLLTSELFVKGPVYRKIKVAVQIIVQAGADLATVQIAVQSILQSFLDPLSGGNEGTGWPFGGEIYYSDVYRKIITVEEVDRIADNQLLFYLDNQLQQFCRDVPINPGELLYNDPEGHTVTVSYESSS
ncbi:MAG: putative baseplate assembly protein [Verrucomicrobia bacterium]|nr:MAG: putative baseplate assembly protein [Verrucomicrobiota bacterium]